MKSQQGQSSQRHFAVAPDDVPTRVILGDDPSLFADSHQSTVELGPNQFLGVRRGSSAAIVVTDDRTRISKPKSTEEHTPPIHIGPLDSRKSLEGESLDHFKLEEFVGGGGMGAVYRAFDTTLNRLVAVKILSRDQSDNETVRRFRNEAQSAARLDHENIARVYYVGEAKGWNFIVFEFIEGANLRDIVTSRGPLPLAEALNYTLQIAEALGHAHIRDVVHRDIKPSNVLVTNDGALKLVDMGLARLHQVEASSDDLTQSGVTLGTFDYIPPEQARDPRLADVRSDIYSLGCTLYFMLVGRPPFPEGTAVQKLFHHVADEPPDVRLFRTEIPEDIVALLAKMLAKKPEQRFQTPTELIAAIGQISQRLQLDLSSVSSIRLPATLVSSGPANPWWYSLLPLGVAVLILLAFALLPEEWNASTVVGPTLPENLTPPALATKENQPTPTVESPAARFEKKPTPPNNVESPTVAEKPKTEPTPPKEERPAAEVAKSPNETTPAVEKPAPAVEVPPTAPVPAVAIRRIVVTDKAYSVSPHELVKATLAEALKYADTNPEVEVIELASATKQFFSSAIEIHSPLTIQAASGVVPEIVLRPSADVREDERGLIQLEATKGTIRFRGLRIRADIPASQRNWTLFQFAKDTKVDLSDCVVTAVNSAGGARFSQRVAMFEPAPVLTTSIVREPMPEVSEPKISVTRSILRGDAAILRLPKDRSLQLSFEDAFVATSDRLVETGGSDSRSNAVLRVSIERSTIAASAGVLLVGSQPDLPFRAKAELDVSASVIVTDAASPLLELRGGEQGEEARYLAYEGSENFYPRTTKFFRRVNRIDGFDQTYDVDFTNLPRWASDYRSERFRDERGLVTGPAAELPTHDQRPADYVLKSPSDTTSGCDSTLLPVVESSTKRPIMSATNMGGMKPDMPVSTMPPIMDDKPTMRPTAMP